MHTEQPQLLEHGAQEQRIGGLRRGGDAFDARRAQRLGELRQVFDDQPAALIGGQRLDFELGEAAPSDLLERRTGQRRGDQPDVRRQLRRQPGQLARAVPVLQLVEPVHDQDRAALLSRQGQPLGEGGAQRFGLNRKRELQVEAPGELGQQPAQHRRPVGAVRRGADEVHQHAVVGVLLPIAQRPVAEQRRLPQPRLADDDQRRSFVLHVGIEGVERARPADVHPGAAAGEAFMVGGLPLERVRLGPRRELLVDHAAEVGQHQLAECPRIGEVLPHGQTAGADAVLELGEPAPSFVRPLLGGLRAEAFDLGGRGPFAVLAAASGGSVSRKAGARK